MESKLFYCEWTILYSSYKMAGCDAIRTEDVHPLLRGFTCQYGSSMERQGWIWNMKSVDLNFFSVMTQEYYNHCVAFVPGFLFYLFLHQHICEDIYIMHEHKVTQQTLLPTFSHESCWLIVGEAPRKAALQQQTSGRGRLQLANMDVNTATL